MGTGMKQAVVILSVSAVVFVSRVSFTPPTLEDIDSVNFALALGDFDPRLHQPHPPGYTVYVGLAKLAHHLVPEPVTALALLSATAQALLVLPLWVLMTTLAERRAHAIVACLWILTNPVLWFNGARPMSDSMGLLFIVVAQALIVKGLKDHRYLVAGSVVTGLSMGTRLQATFLTAPLLLYALARARAGRKRAIIGVVLGTSIWVVPLVVESGGPAAYLAALTETAEESYPAESLVAGVSPNRAIKALAYAGIRPWVSEPLGTLVCVLSSLGLAVAFFRYRNRLGLAVLAFGPYVVIHVLFQNVQAVRFSLPYLPFTIWLAAAGLDWIGKRVLPGAGRAVFYGAAVAIPSWSVVLVVPAMLEYHHQPSPPFAALEALESESARGQDFRVAGHYMFSRYMAFLPSQMDVLPPRPRAEVKALQDAWLDGDAKPVYFLAEPVRTDLQSIAPESKTRMGHWKWGCVLERLLSGERPNQVELIRIAPPEWFAGDGWLLSLEAGRMSELSSTPERKAYLRRRKEPTFVLVAGEPTDTTGHDCELGIRTTEDVPGHHCRFPLLRGFRLPPAASSEGYDMLTVITRRSSSPQGAPFVLHGLSYGPSSQVGFVHGPGWYHPETDENQVDFRWVSAEAKSLVYTPREGAKLVVEAMAPLEYLGSGVGVEIRVNGTPRHAVWPGGRRFRVEIPLAGVSEFQQVDIRVNRSFVPDDIQHNRDRRRLALRIYDFRLLKPDRPVSALHVR